MCELSNNAWPLDIRCSETFGTCVNNMCECSNSFEHDMSYFRYRDCRLPKLFLPIVDAFFIVFSLAAVVYAAKHYRESKALARKIIIANISFSFCSFLLGVVRFIQNHQMTGIAMLINFCNASAAMLCFYMSVYSMAVPLLRMSQTPVEGFIRNLTLIYWFFRIAALCPVIACFVYTDPTNPANDIPWNLCMSAFAIKFTAEMVAISSFILLNGSKMINVIEDLKVESSQAKKVSTDEYLNRVRSYFVYIKKQAPGMVISSLAQPIIHLATGYVPYAFALFSMQYLTSASMSQKITNFTAKSNVLSSGEVSPSTSSKGDLTTSVNHQLVRSQVIYQSS